MTNAPFDYKERFQSDTLLKSFQLKCYKADNDYLIFLFKQNYDYDGELSDLIQLYSFNTYYVQDFEK